HDRAQISLAGDLLHQLQVEVVVARVFTRALDDLAVRELARRALDQALLVGQLEVHRSPLASRPAWPLRTLASACSTARSPAPRSTARPARSGRAPEIGR